MARKRRRRRSSGTAVAEPAVKSNAPVNDRVDNMNPPNHMTSLYEPGSDYATFKEHRFPRVRLMKADPGYSEPTGLVFVDDSYGITRWGEREVGAPATWMDPEIFLRMVLQDPTIQPLVDACIRKRSKVAAKKLEPELERVLEEAYIPYLFEQFAVAKQYLAEWLLAHYADEVESLPDTERNKFYRKPRTA